MFFCEYRFKNGLSVADIAWIFRKPKFLALLCGVFGDSLRPLFRPFCCFGVVISPPNISFSHSWANFVTTIDVSASAYDKIIFSAGRIGYQVEVSLDNLAKIIKFNLKDIV